MQWLTRLLLIYFGARLVFLALSISSYVPPDEVTHAGICKVFSKVLLLPDNGPDTWQYGLVTNIPWLYYFAMGKLLLLNFFGLPDLVFLRLLNIPLAFGTAFYALKLCRLVTEDRLTRLLVLVMVTNAAMFSLLSSSVSYDNLANLFAAMAIYYLFAFFRFRSAGLLAASLLCQLGGALTKPTFLPLILVLVAVLVIHELRRPATSILASLKEWLGGSPAKAWGWLFLILVAVLLNLQLYGGNYLRYGSPTPSMSSVLNPEAAMQYRMEARGMIFSQFKEGKLSYMDAVIKAGEITHPGDKADTFRLLMNWQNLQQNPGLWLSPSAYSWLWFKTMTGTILGIKAHLPMLKSPGYLVPVYLVMLLALAGCVLRWRPTPSGWASAGMTVIVLFYAGFLMHEINWDAYQNYGEPGITLYGRYLLPVIVPVYVLGSYYLLQLFRDQRVRLALAAAVALLFISYDFPWFLAHATPEWYSWLPR